MTRALRRAQTAVVERGGLVGRLLRRRGVTGVGIGPRQKNGKWRRKERCVQVFVQRKVRPTGSVPATRLLPNEVDGAAVDVIEAEFFGLDGCSVAEADRRLRCNPIAGGLAVAAVERDEFGTLGLLLRDQVAFYALTAAHVVGGVGNTAAQPFFRPDAIGNVAVSKWSTKSNLDAALVQLKAGAGRVLRAGMFPDPALSHAITDIRDETGTLVVHGACHGKVRAVVVSNPWSGVVRYRDGSAITLRNHVVVETVGGRIGPGDSGSVLVAGGRRAVGLLVAANLPGTFGIVTPLPDILGDPAFQPNGQPLRSL